MKKTCTLITFILFTVIAICQKTNPAIGKKEFEISLFYLEEHEGIFERQHLASAQIVRRWSWKKYTKVGVGGLVGVQDYDPIHKSDFVTFGSLFGDITQFIGQRQKLSVGGTIGHGIFKREQKFEATNYKIFNKLTAGMFYSISFGYRPIISKKLLMVVSPVYSFRNFRRKSTEEYFSPPSVDEYESKDKRSGFGLRLGVVF